MKNLFPILLLFGLFCLIGCQNPQPKNGVIRDSVESQTIQNDTTPSVSMGLKPSFEPPKPLLPKSGIFNRCRLPFVVTIDSNETAASESNLTKKSQFFTIKTDVETTVKGAEGTTLTIPADCFQTKEGNILRGSVQLELKEFQKTSDMILANLVTESDGKLLETGGMIYLNATDKDGNVLKIKQGKDIKITLPHAPNSEDKQLFYGNLQTNGRINWTLAKPSVDSFTTPIYTIVEKAPEFIEGQASLFKYLQNSITYPKLARMQRIEGTVYVSFTVLQNGQIARVRILRGIGGGCNEVAMNIVKQMPRWKPGLTQGMPVPVTYTLPVKFTLNDNSLRPSDSLISFNGYSLKDSIENEEIQKYDEIQNAQNYIMRTQNLGWINCDRFLNLQNTQKTDFVVWNNKPDTEIRLVFKNFRSIMSAWSGDEKKAQFIGVPVGQPVYIVATSPDSGKYNVSVTETTILKDQSTTIELKSLEKEVFLKELHRLDKSEK